MKFLERLFWSCILGNIITYGIILGEAIVGYLTPTGIPIHMIILDSANLLMAALISFVIMWFLRRYYRDRSNLTKETDNISLALLISISIASLLFIFVLDRLTGGLLFDTQWTNAFAILLMALINFSVLFIYLRLAKYYDQLSQLTAQQQLFQAELANIKRTEVSYNELRSLKHDLKNQNLVLLGLAKEGKNEEIQNVLSVANQRIDDTEIFYTNNQLLNFVLNEKQQEAKSRGADLQIQVLLPEKTKLPNDVLAVVIGNLIDNGIAAIQRLGEPLHNEMALTIKSFQKNIVIETSNPFDDHEVKTRLDRQREGYGVKNIRRVVEDAGGIYKQWTQDDHYITTILLLNAYE